MPELTGQDADAGAENQTLGTGEARRPALTRFLPGSMTMQKMRFIVR